MLSPAMLITRQYMAYQIPERFQLLCDYLFISAKIFSSRVITRYIEDYLYGRSFV